MIESFIAELERTLDSAARQNFGKGDKWVLQRSMEICGMTELPKVVGDPNGERCSGKMLCEKCGNSYFAHPLDWRVIEHGDLPFLNILCDGRRVKL